MKKLGWGLLMGLALLLPKVGTTHPFRTQYVCVPPLSPSANPLEFEIRDGGNCAEGDTYMAVQPQKDGSVLLLPSNPPLDPEVQKDFENFKKYYGR